MQTIPDFVPLKVLLLFTVNLINTVEEDVFLSGESELPRHCSYVAAIRQCVLSNINLLLPLKQFMCICQDRF